MSRRSVWSTPIRRTQFKTALRQGSADHSAVEHEHLYHQICPFIPIDLILYPLTRGLGIASGWICIT